MKVFLIEMGYRGGFVILANSKEEALEKLKKDGDDLPPDPETRIKEMTGEVYRFYGDA